MTCFIFHNWYYGMFQTGERSKFTDDHIGINGRACLDCHKKQVKDIFKNPAEKKWHDVNSFRKDGK